MRQPLQSEFRACAVSDGSVMYAQAVLNESCEPDLYEITADEVGFCTKGQCFFETKKVTHRETNLSIRLLSSADLKSVLLKFSVHQGVGKHICGSQLKGVTLSSVCW